MEGPPHKNQLQMQDLALETGLNGDVRVVNILWFWISGVCLKLCIGFPIGGQDENRGRKILSPRIYSPIILASPILPPYIPFLVGEIFPNIFALQRTQY